MKKSIIAMAVAGALAVPAIASADATLYGSLRVIAEKADNNKTDVRNQGSRLGVRGNVDLGLQDTTGIYQAELRFDPVGAGSGNTQGANANTVTRGGNNFLGATGSWGTAIAGVLDHPTYSLVSARTEIGSLGYDVAVKPSYVDETVTSTVAYRSPSISGFQAVLGTVMNGGASDTYSNVDGWQVGAAYSGVENLNLGAAWGKVSSNANLSTTGVSDGSWQDKNKWGLSADYKIEALKLAASYERVKDKETNVTDKGWGVSATYNITSGLSAAARYTTAKTNVDGSDRRKVTHLELANKMGNGVVAAGYADRNKAVMNGDDTFYVGYRLNF